MKSSVRALLETAFLFGLLCWIYVVAFQIARPDSVYWPVVRWFPILRMDALAEAAFVISLVSFFILRWRR